MEEKLVEEIEELTETQQAFDMLSLEEEIKRVEKQDLPLEIPDSVLESDIYKNIMTQAYATASGIRVLLDAGIDYSNSVSIINNFMMNYDSRELTKVQVQQQLV